MMMIIFKLLIILNLIKSRKIIPMPGKPIELSFNNKNHMSDYTFNFYLEEDTLNGYDIWIKFPLDSYTSFVANTNCNAFLTSESKLINNKSVNCKLNGDKIFIIRIDELFSGLNNLHKIRIKSINNPNQTKGTGQFILEIRKGLSNIFDFNHNFASIAFADTPSTIGSPNISNILNNEINQLGNYRFQGVFNNIKIPINARILIKIADKLKLSNNITILSSLKNNINFTKIDDNLLMINELNENNNNSISFDITINNIINMSYFDSPGNWEIYLLENVANTIISKVINLTVSQNTPHTIAYPSSNIIILNFNKNNFKRVVNEKIVYNILITVQNDIPENGSVILEYPSNFTVTKCWSEKGIIGISSINNKTCQIGSNKITIKNFKKIVAYTQISIDFLASNPDITEGSNSGNFSFKSYKDNITLPVKTIDQSTINFIFENIKPLQSLVKKPSTTFRARQNGNLEIDFILKSVISTGNKTIKVILEKEFIFLGQFRVILSLNGTNITINSSHSLNISKNSENELVVEFNINNTITTSSNSIKFETIDSSNYIKSPKISGEYYIKLEIIDTVNSFNYRISNLYLIDPELLDTTTFNISSYTIDHNSLSIYKFSFFAPYILEKSYWVEDENNYTTYIEIKFPTFSTTNLFKIDLNTSKNTGEEIPCYGKNLLFKSGEGINGDNTLKCVITRATSVASNNFVIVKLSNYEKLATEGLVEFHIPGIFNQESLTNRSNIIINVYKKYRYENNIILTNNFQLIQNTAINLLSNNKNNNGILGVSTNISPIFNPSKINMNSYIEIKITPIATINSGGGFIIFVPSLSATTIQYYILPSQNKVSCVINNTKTDCFSFRKSNILLINNLKNNLLLNNEITIYIYGIKNPPFVQNFNIGFRIKSFQNNFKELEDFKFLNLNPFDYGLINDTSAKPNFYEANNVNVEYEWVFTITNPIPENGYIILNYPTPQYDLESSSPCPTIELKRGIEWINPSLDINIVKTTCSDIFKVGTVKIYNIKPIKANTTLIILVKGVKNPLIEGFVPYFTITTHYNEGFIIDSNLQIKQIYILRSKNKGNIVFDSFYTVPNNGNIRGDYYINFYPNNNIPKNGQILIKLPKSEFSISDFPTNKYCKVTGSLKTYKDCQYSTTEPNITLTLDENLEVEAGMNFITIILPNILNFNPELYSGNVKITTIYDNVIIDDTLNEEIKQKALTTKTFSNLVINSFSLSPNTEGSPTKLSVSFTTNISIPKDPIILLEFPNEFPRDLSDNLYCFGAELKLSDEDDIECFAYDWKLNITNIKGWSDCPCNISFEIDGIIMPNKITNIVNGINLFLFKDEFSVSEKKDNIGAFTISFAPESIKFTSNINSLSDARLIQNQIYNIIPNLTTASYSFNKLYLQFDKEFNLEILSWDLAFLFNGSNFDIKKLKNDIEVTFTTNQTINSTTKVLNLNNISNGYNNRKVDFIKMNFINSNSLVIKMYQNLIPENPFNFINQKKIIDFERQDNIIELISGTLSENLILRSNQIINSNIQITPRSNLNYLILKNFNVSSNTNKSLFSVGAKNVNRKKKTWLTFTHTSNEIEPIKPIKVIIINNRKVKIDVSFFQGLPEGGKSEPIFVNLERSPAQNITLNLFKIGQKPENLEIYPSIWNFNPGETRKHFWLSVSRSSKGSNGSIIFTMDGLNKDSFNFPTRKYSFLVYESKIDTPIILDFISDGIDKNNSLEFKVITDSISKIYYSIVPRGTQSVKFSEIKKKKLDFDYFLNYYYLGAKISNTFLNENTVKINNLSSNQDFVLKIFSENSNGNLSEALIKYYSTKLLFRPAMFIIETNKDTNKEDLLNVLKGDLNASNAGKLSFENIEKENFIEYIYDKNNLILSKDINDTMIKQNLNLEEEKLLNLTVKNQESLYNKYNKTLINVNIPNIKANISESINIEKVYNNPYPINEDLGLSFLNYENFIKNENKLKDRKLLLQSIGYSFKYNKERFYIDRDPDYRYYNESLNINYEQNKQYIKIYLNRDTNYYRTTTKELIAEVEKGISKAKTQGFEIPNYFYGYLNSTKLKWSGLSHPYIKNITENKISIGGISLKEESEISYIITNTLRSEYLNSFSVGQNKTLKYNNTRYNCNELDFFSVFCYFGSYNETYLNIRDDIFNYTKFIDIPTTDQIINGMDSSNFKIIKSGKYKVNSDMVNKMIDLNITGLNNNSNYTLFITAEKKIDKIFKKQISKNDILYFVFNTQNYIIVIFSLIFRCYIWIFIINLI